MLFDINNKEEPMHIFFINWYKNLFNHEQHHISNTFYGENQIEHSYKNLHNHKKLTF